ncbi:MAG TPA: Wzz/FepE/Etk N-terminal domain-containing protein [Solirubrobacteraceae bacterium]|nr:Wzz/FepE/Etk N-terminal domain-containing protein [Solirubrobacteraceae bacterium]
MNETTDAIAIFAPIWRRKWLILAVGIVVAAASYFYYKRQRPTFQSTTQVFLGAAAEEQAPTERSTKNRNSTLSDQAAVINTIVVEQVRNRLRKEGKAELAKSAKVKAKSPEKSEFITITAEAHSAKGTALLANLTAESYIKRQKDKRKGAIEKAIAISRRQLRRIEQAALAKAEKPTTKKKAGSTNGSEAAAEGSGGRTQQAASSVIQEANLSSKINQLESSLGTVSAQQVKRAKPSGAVRLSPKPRKDAIFGFVLGLVLAAIAAYAFSRFDRRLRGLSRIEAVMGLPLLSAMPKVRRPIVRGGGSSPRPSVHLLEPLRRLQAALQMADAPGGFPSVGGAIPVVPPLPGSPPVPAGASSPVPVPVGAYAPAAAPLPGASQLPGSAPAVAPGAHGRPRVILFVSPDPGDGKSTLLADLALVQRDAGERVVIVEANFRRPIQGRLLGVEQEGRLAGMLTGRLDFDGAAARVLPAVSPSEHSRADDVQHGVATAVQAEAGSLFVLGGDASVPNPPALLAQQATAELLRSLAVNFDSVLIDAPSPLEVSDVIPLLGIVDRIVVVARVGHSREASAQRLRELLEHPSCAPVAGAVANFVASGELKRYGFSSLNGRVGRLTGR